MDELKLIFASNLIRLRTAAGMTQAELGEQLNYSDKSISKWERGEAIPDAAVLKRMSEIFGRLSARRARCLAAGTRSRRRARPQPRLHHSGRSHGHRHAGGAGVCGAVAVAGQGGVGRVSLLRAGGAHYVSCAQQRVFNGASG